LLNLSNLKYYAYLFHPFNQKNRENFKKNILHNQFKRLAPKALVDISKVFLSYQPNINVWLAFGTLLGAYRENKIIDYDYDLDFGIMDSDMTEDFIKHLEENGFTLYKHFCIKSEDNLLNNFVSEYTFIYEGFVLLDFFVFKEVNNQISAFLFDAEDGLTWNETLNKYNNGLRTIKRSFSKFNYKKIFFYDSEFLIPENTDLYLREAYGDDFMTPKQYTYSERPRTNECILDDTTLGIEVKNRS